MELKISAPVGDKNRITIADKKGEKFKAVANKPDDVRIVQLMLIANGKTVPLDGKVSGGMIKAIQAFQKSALKFKKPDGIVDPGGKTWNAGLSKLKVQHEANLKALEQRVPANQNGKEVQVLRKDFEKQQAEMLKKFADRAASFESEIEGYVQWCLDAEDTLSGAEGFMNQLAEFSIRAANAKAKPPFKELYTARSEATYLGAFASHSTPKWDKLIAQDKKTVKAYNAAVKAYKAYIEARIGTGSAIAGNLELAREVSATACEVYLTAQLTIKYRGKISPVQAHMMAAATVEAVKSSAGQVGEVAAGNKKVTWTSAAETVAIDTAFAAGGAYIGGKLGAKMEARFVGDFSVKLFSKIGKKGVPKQFIDEMITKFLRSPAGQSFIENLAKEHFMLFKVKLQKGKVTGKDFEDAFLKAATGGLLKGGIGKSVEKFSGQKTVHTKAVVDKLLESKFFKSSNSAVLSKFPDKKLVFTILKENRKEMAETVANTIAIKPAESVMLKTASALKGTETDKQIGTIYEAELRKSKELHDEVDRLMESEIAKRYKKLEKAK